MEGKRLSDDTVLKTDPRYRKLEHLIQVSVLQRENILVLNNPLINLIFRAVARVRSRMTRTWL